MHDHSHDTDTYYLDQLCMIGITGAFAGVCLTLYFFNTSMLQLLLQDQFHPMILAAGITLMIVTLVRAAVVWQAAGKKNAGHTHDHAHDHHHHEHEHDHHHEHGEHCDHNHDHGKHSDHDHHHHHGEQCGHDHHHEHVKPAVATYHSPALPMVSHDHGHAHGADDGHDHGWAPWRYVVLLVPMMLYLLGLPGKAMPLSAPGGLDVTQDWAKESTQVARLVALQQIPLAQVAFSATMALDSDTTTPVEFKQLEAFAFDPRFRETWKDKKVVVTGQFVPYPDNDRLFFLSRLRIQCCGADAIQLNVPIYCRESVKDLKKEDWVRVVGRVEFRQQANRPGIYMTVLVVGRADDIVKTTADTRPYIN